MKGTWQTTGSGSGALGELAGLVIGAALLAAVAVPLINAITNLLIVAAIIVGCLVVLGSVGLVLLLRIQARRSRAITAPAVSPPRPDPQRLSAPQRPAIEGKQLHLHFHGVDAEDLAGILRDVNRERE